LPWHKSDVMKLIAEVDRDGNGTVEFDEFLWMIKKLQGASPRVCAAPACALAAGMRCGSPIVSDRFLQRTAQRSTAS
jgi:hypothetical protein